VLYALLSLLSFFQPDAVGGGTGGGAPGAGGGVPAGASSGCAMQAGMLLVMVAIFYFLLIRPQQKRQKEHDSLLRSLRAGQIVRTSGGIRGEIVSINDHDATLLIADKVKINILRAQLAGLDVPPAADDKAAAKKKDDEKKD
jgi:preprotein translocase subunit YajC